MYRGFFYGIFFLKLKYALGLNFVIYGIVVAILKSKYLYLTQIKTN